jgi:hypothetical protein
MARLCSVPRVLKIAKTSCSSTRRRVACTVCWGLYSSSRNVYEMRRPFTPPRALTYLKYASAPRATEA